MAMRERRLRGGERGDWVQNEDFERERGREGGRGVSASESVSV